MKIFVSVLIAASFLTCCNSKSEGKNNPVSNRKKSVSDTIWQKKESVIKEQKKSISDFVPAGFVMYKEEGMKDVKGDLNGDGLEDVVLMIKGTDKSQFVNHEYRGILDRNRRGIIILFNKGEGYVLATKNYTCFSSENEEGGVYYAPELGLSIEKGNLKINYAHGRYGYWSYTFRYRNSDFYLIGYDSSDNHGPIVNTITSINYLTGKKLIKDNINKDNPDADEFFEETWSKIESKKLKKLSEIKDFDDFES